MLASIIGRCIAHVVLLVGGDKYGGDLWSWSFILKFFGSTSEKVRTNRYWYGAVRYSHARVLRSSHYRILLCTLIKGIDIRARSYGCNSNPLSWSASTALYSNACLFLLITYDVLCQLDPSTSIYDSSL